MSVRSVGYVLSIEGRIEEGREIGVVVHVASRGLHQV